ncbi:hypothetical protein [Micromonospora pattaloongensis]|uniref:hypothetical protein n=1 Tax=Micromonospora pattaloongensis TaxID=405436 RepID=UPI0011153036|nr:hypothetical protein [Micromonospora pattaloongensis]
MPVLTAQVSLAAQYREPIPTIYGLAFGAVWIVAGILMIRHARFTGSIPPEELGLQPGRLSTNFWMLKPKLLGVAGYLVAMIGAGLVVSVLVRLVARQM